MTKFILLMYLCSNIPGNACQQFQPKYTEFNSYHHCAIYGYKYSVELLESFNSEFINEYRVFTAFDCEEDAAI